MPHPLCLLPPPHGPGGHPPHPHGPKELALECCEACLSTCFEQELPKRAIVKRVCGGSYGPKERSCDDLCVLQHTPQQIGTMLVLAFMLLMLARSRWSFFPVRRVMGAMVCAVLVVANGFMDAELVLRQGGLIDWETIVILFGLTAVTGYLEHVGLVELCSSLMAPAGMTSSASSARGLMLRVCLLATFVSVLFTNDAAVVILTEPLVRLCLELNLHPEPFLVALATSANIGSVLTPIGNPQDILIKQKSGIGFGKWFLLMAPVGAAGLAANYFLLLLFYRRRMRMPLGAGLLEASAVLGEDGLPVSTRASRSLQQGGAEAEGGTRSFSSQLLSFKASWSEGLVGGRESEELTSSAAEKVARRSMRAQRVMFILTILAMLAASYIRIPAVIVLSIP